MVVVVDQVTVVMVLNVRQRGCTALHLAAEKSRADIARMLLEWQPELACMKDRVCLCRPRPRSFSDATPGG